MPHRRFAFDARAATVLAWAVTLVALAPPALSQDPPGGDPVDELRAELAILRAEYAERLAALEAKLAALEAERTTLRPEAPPQPPAAPAPAATQASNYFNPAISLVGDFVAVGGRSGSDDLPSSQLRESELGLQAVIDPYARADFYFAFGEEGVEVEEGYVTFTSLPSSFLVKVGRMRAQFGKVNSQHADVLPWADTPLPIVNLLGGEEGWIGDGVSVARLFPLPGDTFSEATLQVFRGEAEGLFAGDERSDLAYDLHYRVFRDLTEATNLDLGLSYAFGPNDSQPDAETRLEGVNATWRWKPLQRALYRGVVVRGELFRSRREQPEGTLTADGWFTSVDVRLGRRWWLGGRYESSERAAEPHLTDTGEALILTFWPSEFSQLRGELRRREYDEGRNATELLLQLQFSMGTHATHPF
jgi:hypothetical protein